jgi:ubiquilin
MNDTSSLIDMRHLKIKSIDGQTYELTVPKDILISEFRKAIEEKTQVPHDRQRLIYKAKLLADELPLSHYVKEDGESIHLVKKPTEAAQVPPA